MRRAGHLEHHDRTETWLAVDQPVILAFVEHGANVTFALRLRAALALARLESRWIRAARSLRRPRLGGVGGIQA